MSRGSAWSSMGTPGKVALFAFVCALAALLVSSRHLVSAATTPAARVPAASGSDQQRNQQYATALDGHLKQTDGRSLFFVPSAPPPPAPPPAPKTSDEPPKPPPPPARYGGPNIIAMLNDTVWFDNGKKLEVGQSDSSVKVVKLDAPWSATLEWKGVEFTVDLFKKDRVVAPEPPPAAGGSAKPEEKEPRLSASNPPNAPSGTPADSGKE